MSTVVFAACRTPPEDSVPRVPRGLETRVVESTDFGECRALGSVRGELRPVDCAPPRSLAESGELVALIEPGRQAAPESLALAAASAVALSPDRRTIERSIHAISSAAGSDFAEPSAWIALGALEHARARASGDPAHLVDALESTGRAIEIDPESPAALFNRAVIEGDLGLCRQARRSWRAYLAVDRSSEWADEGRVRLRALPCREGSGRPARRSSGRLEPGDRDRLFEATLEELLPRWLEEVPADPDAAAASLHRLSERAARFEADAGDPWLVELAAELGGDRHEPAYLEAVGRYVRGRKLFREEDYLTAGRLLSAARPTLQARDSALLLWCDLWLAGIDLYRGRSPAAADRLGRLAAAPRVQRSPMLVGRVAWARGLAAIRAGRLQEAYDRYSEAERAFEQGGYTTSSASIHMLEGEALADLGFTKESWRDRVSALRALQGPEPHFMLRNALLDGATVAGRQGAFRVARSLLDEVQALAEESDDRTTATEALLFRAETLVDAGDASEASAAFSRALEAAGTLPQGLVRQRFEVHSRLGLWATRGSSAKGDLSPLDGIIRFFADRGPQSLELWALRVKARLAAATGREALARETVAEAIRAVRRTQRQLREESFEVRHWEMAQAVFNEAVTQAVVAAAPVEALGFLEEARDLGGETSTPLPFERCTLAEAARTYPLPATAGSVAIAYGVVGDDLFWWRIAGDRCLFGRTKVTRTRSMAQRLDAAVRSRNPPREALDALYEELLAGPLAGVPKSLTLRVVPDGFLLRVPFAALRNSETGERLIEERAVSFHQDLASALRASGGASAGASRRRWSVLAVGDPAFDRAALPWLDRLPGARLEAERVASSYAGSSELLLGRDATLGRVRDGLHRHEVLQLAAHALTSPGGVNDGLVLASDESGGGSSGLRPVRDLLPGAAPDLQLVVLSGCSTLGSVPTRSSGLAGLARPFIARGVPAVVGTLWPVPDEVLRELMTRFHAGILQGAAASEALRDAQLEVFANSPDDSGFDWAAVQLYGDLPAETPDGNERKGP
jgi:CHAT domain-containing protein